MDRLTWMYKIPRVSHDYVNGVNEFIACAVENLKKKQTEHGKEDRITCPYRDCSNLKKYPNIDTVHEHLFRRGFMEDYTKWIWHGEGIHTSKTETSSIIYESYGDSLPRNEEDNAENDRVEEMIQDVEEILVHQPEVLENLVDDSKKSLYHGCNVQFTRLSTTLKLCKLKVKNGWSDKSFTEMLKLLAEMLPAKNELPTSTYEAKKIVSNGRLFANSNDAKLVRWHVEGRKSDGMLRHPADSPQWRTIDGKFPEFGGEVRNLRLGLCADGMNPYHTLSSTHSTWPVLLTIYNLPPWLCMKRKYIMLTLLIPSPKEAGNNIDVYLQPLIEDLKLSWDQGEKMYDAYSQIYFNFRAMIFCTISDFPGYGNLSGYTIKGAKACPICEDATIDLRLKNCKKMTLLNIHGKTKDGMKARLDLQELGVRAELAPQQSGKHAYLPPACYTLSRKEKISFCECLSSVKVPSGYSSNLKNLVSMKDLKLLGLKSYDCHVLMQHLLPVAIRGILPRHVRVVITKLCFFFNAICSKVIDPLTLEKLQADIIVKLCEFEMYFLHSFLDIMVHLVTHLVREIKIYGPLYVRQMYPFERFLCILKAYVRNRRHPEASIVGGYSVEETIEFCTDYLASTDPVGIPRSRHEGRLDSQGTVGHKMITLGAEMLDRAHLFVLQHMTKVNPYLQEHILEIR
ncbi:uncharacterized protein LOC141660050 [Apium graveolens]|uniref:uncharacterized protein LOC141660050 n=1 Tax=Apium graveolens TaxID=4045 RepID=UPI003D7AED2C